MDIATEVGLGSSLIISKDEAEKLVADIHASGVLGRSSVYPRLLDYLVEKTSSGQICSEVDLAKNVFFKKDEFDQTTDSSVRVYVHNLRKKLQRYYEEMGKNDTYRIHIPKGSYRVEFLDAESYSNQQNGKNERLPNQSNTPSPTVQQRRKLRIWAGLAVLCSLILLISLSIHFTQKPDRPVFTEEQLAFWGGVLTDEKPVRILLNNATGRFGTQSLSVSAVANPDNLQQPIEVPDLLIRLVDLLEQRNRPVEIGYLTEFSPEDIRGDSHIIYTDHIDGIPKLAEVLRAADQLKPEYLVSRLLDKQADASQPRIQATQDARATDFGMIFKEQLQLAEGDSFEFLVLAGNGFTGQSAVLQIAQSQQVLTEMQLSESETLSGGLSALFQITASDGFHPQRILLSSETH